MGWENKIQNDYKLILTLHLSRQDCEVFDDFGGTKYFDFIDFIDFIDLIDFTDFIDSIASLIPLISLMSFI